MLRYNEITAKKFIVIDGEPYEVLSSNVFRKQQRKPVNQAKLRNIITKKVIEKSFQQSDKADEADIESKEIKYLYNAKGVYWFTDPENLKDRFSLDQSKIPAGFKFIMENDLVTSLIYNDDVIGFKLPIKVTLKVKEAPPALKGNTSAGADKVIELETGATITAPIFIKNGDLVEINTETGGYAGRA